MKYRNATERLPENLVAELQKFAAGELLYVPAVRRKPWGEGSGAKTQYARRNAEIREKRMGGQSVDTLSDAYCISDEAVRKIIYRKGESSMNLNEIDYSGYFWQNDLVRLQPSMPEEHENSAHFQSLLDSHQRFLNEGELELPWNRARWKSVWENYVNSNQDGSSWVLISIETLDGVKVGGGNIHCIDERNGTFGLFCTVDPPYRGMSYEFAAGRLLLDYAFNERRLHICCNYSFDGDEYGNAFYQGLGFKKEGVLRARAFHQGRHWDEIHYSLTATEFNEAKT